MYSKIETALISVSDKDGLLQLVQYLQQKNIKIISTGGTSKLLKDAGINVVDVSEVTNFPEILDGRVKTLHPNIHAALLAVRDNEEHKNILLDLNIKTIDLVIVNLYPFAKVVETDAPYSEAVENIDIGGPSMIRSAAKNHQYLTVITDKKDYQSLIDELEANEQKVSYGFRQRMAAKAFMHTASYDTIIGNWFSLQINDYLPQTLNVSLTKKQSLRYGENPHQHAAIYALSHEKFSIINAKQLQGKELSYNNIHDADAAYNLIAEFKQPAATIIKHTNPCGTAVADNIFAAYSKALAGDPLSAFGGIIAINRELDDKTAEEMSKLFAEVIIAPAITDDAQKLLSVKKNLRVLIVDYPKDPSSNQFHMKSIRGGMLVKQQDNLISSADDLKIVTKITPSQEQINNMLFAFSVCKHVKSNAIVIANNMATIGVGAGQMSRVDSVKIAFSKAIDGENKDLLENAVLASDAFFPFADSIVIAAKYGVKAIIQPGGSIQDSEVIKEADNLGVTMVFTGNRHFKH